MELHGHQRPAVAAVDGPRTRTAESLTSPPVAQLMKVLSCPDKGVQKQQEVTALREYFAVYAEGGPEPVLGMRGDVVCSDHVTNKTAPSSLERWRSKV